MKLVIKCLTVLMFFSCTQEKRRTAVITDKAPKPVGPYSQAIRAGGTLFVSGQIGMTSGGVLDSTDIVSETKQVMENLKAVIEAAGLKMSDVCRSTIYLVNIGDYQAVNQVYSGYFSSEPPARETVSVKALPKSAHVEISVIARDPD